MMRFFFIAIFLCCTTIAVAPGTLLSEIDWCNRKQISWSDFWRNPDPYSRYSAVSATYLQEKHACDNFGQFKYSVKAVFVKDQSWSRDKRSTRLLHHEQLHFNLTELHARKLRKLFSDLRNPCYIPERRIQLMIDSLYDKMEFAHRFYDDDTFHGLNNERQQFWDELVNSALEELAPFSCEQ
ncbi:DUF922 domain-containing protein [Sphingobacteriales bacterium UPWRP_1]|nr:hypothetical protein B6N25_01225 [Sphingobacteriales bacterium TSM_CSS]PSJ72593.1 DUF922 domain-containing protein [Sphingobacteriales bacterium UPWRP_1]